jgi:uncharacterized DUF497 family protein
MRIDELVWDEWNEEQVAGHGVRPEEAEEVVWDRSSIILRTRSADRRRVVALGLTEPGRPILVLAEDLGSGRLYVVAARDMTDGEIRRFKERKG